MSILEQRVLAYIATNNHNRAVFVNPEGYEEGYYFETKPTIGKPYYWKAYSLHRDEDGRHNGGNPFLVDESADSPEICATFVL